MRTSLAPLLLILLAAPLRAETARSPSWLDDAAQPGYLAAEKIADGFYGVVRENIAGPNAAPDDSSYQTFSQELSERQARAARRDWEARPAPGALSSSAIDRWLGASIAGHRDALVDAFAASLAERYQLKGFGYFRETEYWSGGALASAALFGGAYAYFAGVRAGFDAGPLKVGLDLTPGKCLRTLPRAADSRRLARVELSKPGMPLSLYAEWGPARAADRLGANWSARF